MEIGHTFTRRGQRYVLRGFINHVTADDRWVVLADVSSWCADCGARFDFRITRSAITKWGFLNRRCPKHHSPGRPANPPNKTPPKRSSCKRALPAGVCASEVEDLIG